MKIKKNVFITGATGFLGSFLIKELLKNPEIKVWALARSNGRLSANQRVIDAIKFAKYKNDKLFLNNLEIVEGDVALSNLGICQKDKYDYLVSKTNYIIHSAALAELTVPLDIIRSINVEGTRNILKFAMLAQKYGLLKKFNHISTIYVAGAVGAIEFDETMLDIYQGFNNTYEQTKFEAELVVRKYINKGLNCSIFRPSMIIGDSVSGKTNNFKLFYQPLHFFNKEIFDEFPCPAESSINLIHIDTVISDIVKLFDKADKNGVYHLLSPNNILLQHLVIKSSEYFGFKIPNFIDLNDFNISKLSPVKQLMAKPFIPYFNYRTKFKAQSTFNILEGYGLMHDYISLKNLQKIFYYCHKVNFIRKR
jgi:thioester reductase-like protein